MSHRNGANQPQDITLYMAPYTKDMVASLVQYLYTGVMEKPQEKDLVLFDQLLDDYGLEPNYLHPVTYTIPQKPVKIKAKSKQALNNRQVEKAHTVPDQIGHLGIIKIKQEMDINDEMEKEICRDESNIAIGRNDGGTSTIGCEVQGTGEKVCDDNKVISVHKENEQKRQKRNIDDVDSTENNEDMNCDGKPDQKDEEGIYKLSACDSKSYESAKQKRKRIKTKDGISEKSQFQNQLGNNSNVAPLTNTKLMDSVKLEPSKSLDQYSCSSCNKILNSYSDLIKHIHETENNCKKVRKRNQGPFHCLMCDKVFSSRSQYVKHNKETHTTDSVENCRICGKSFIGKDIRLMKQHMRVHVTGKQFRN